MRKILSLVVGLFFLSISFSQADDQLGTDQLKSLIQDTEGLTVEKQLVGVLGAISGTVKTETRE